MGGRNEFQLKDGDALRLGVKAGSCVGGTVAGKTVLHYVTLDTHGPHLSPFRDTYVEPVSYTHLTLPTIYSV